MRNFFTKFSQNGISRKLFFRKIFFAGGIAVSCVLIVVLAKIFIFKNAKESKSESSITSQVITKRLEAIQRAGALNTTFNPYAVQEGDILKVYLDIANVERSFTAEDDLLMIKNDSSAQKICTTNITNGYSPPGGNPISDGGWLDSEAKKVIWSGIAAPVAGGVKNLYYYCQVGSY